MLEKQFDQRNQVWHLILFKLFPQGIQHIYLIIRMYHFIKARTNGISCYGTLQELEKLQQMFPIDAADDQDISEALHKHFNPSDPQHIRFLQQACYKTPLADVAKVYEQFREEKVPNLKEPQISSYFQNNKFVSLKVLQKWLDGNGQYPSVAKNNQMKQQIAQALLSISEEYGYIPNLQRFLLYYPNYLIKVLKFKNRFFQQRVQQTSEVTYLSPKNCCFAGILAAVQMGCPYMIARMVKMFLVRDGNPAWITDRKYPQQFRPLFSLFRKIAVAPWSLNENDLVFNNTTWSRQVYFDYITVGMFVMSMSTISLAMGLVPDEPCKYVPLNQIMEIKAKYDHIKYEEMQNKTQLAQQIREILSVERQLTKQQVQIIEGKQVEPYMKQIGHKIGINQLHLQINKLFSFIGIPKYEPVNMKAKNNSFFHRYRDDIEKGLQEQRKSDKTQDTKFDCFKSYCIEGSNMTFNNFGKTQQNTRIFRKLIQVMTYNLCGYHNQSFDYKKYIKLNTDFTMPIKFYIRLLSISPIYINKQVLDGINHEREGWIQCFDLGHLAIMVSENKAKLLMTSIQAQFQY